MAGFGMRLVRSAGMEGFTGNLNEYLIDPANTNPIFTNDLVALSAGGYLQEATGASDNNDFDLIGVFAGCHYVDAEGGVKFRQVWSGEAGASEIKAQVAGVPHSRFYIKGDAATDYTLANTVGKRFGVKYAAGTTMYGESRLTLGAAVSATGPLFVHRLAPLPDNSWDSDEPIFEVGVVRYQGAA